MLEYIIYGLGQALVWKTLLVMIIGVIIGIFVGGTPGLSVTIAVSLMLPFTFGMEPSMAILMLVAVYCAGIYAGSTGAILLRAPGTPASIATAADGFALTQQGRAGEALGMALYASVIGGLISGLVLLFVAPQVAIIALRFGPPEYFTLALFGLTVIAGVSGGTLAKGIVMACIGMLVATVGIDPISGVTRFTFDSQFLIAGINLIPVLLGLFAIGEVLNQSQRGVAAISTNPGQVKSSSFRWRDVLPFRKTILKSSFIGVIIGAIPGASGTIAAFLSINEARRVSKNPESFGKGNLDAIAAAESSNNGTTGAALIPMMTLGVPGDVVTAVMLGALLIQGLQPGPQLFQNNGDIVYTVMVGVLIVNVLMFFIGKYSIRWISRVSIVPASILFPIVIVFSLIGAFAFDNQFKSIWIALFFGFLGYLLPKYGYPIVPLLIGIVLGPLAESSFRQSMIMSHDSLSIFFVRPISVFFIVLILLTILIPVIQSYRAQKAQ